MENVLAFHVSFAVNKYVGAFFLILVVFVENADEQIKHCRAQMQKNAVAPANTYFIYGDKKVGRAYDFTLVMKRSKSCDDLHKLSRLSVWDFQENVILPHYPGWHLDPKTFLLKHLDDNVSDSSDTGESSDDANVNWAMQQLKSDEFLFIDTRSRKIMRKGRKRLNRNLCLGLDPNKKKTGQVTHSDRAQVTPTDTAADISL